MAQAPCGSDLGGLLVRRMRSCRPSVERSATPVLLDTTSPGTSKSLNPAGPVADESLKV